MLKLFFGVAGVLFIGLGLFGGNVLEGFSGDSSNKIMDQVQTAATVTEGTATAVVTTASASDTSSVAIPAAPKIVAAPVVAQAIEQVPQQVTAKVDEELMASAASAAENGTTQVDPAVAMLADNSGGEGAVPMAPAQAAGDLIAMAEQAKSSNRNEQVNMANAVLTSNETPSSDGSMVVDVSGVNKDAEVEAAIKSTAGGVGIDPLIVIKDKVNLRDGPSIDHPIVLTLQQGQELMEFKREGKWVHVGAYGTSGKIGWVHERLVGAVAR